MICKDLKLEGGAEGQQTVLNTVANVKVEGSIPSPSLNHCLYCSVVIRKGKKFCSSECSSKQIIKNTTLRIEAGKCTKDARIKQYLLERYGNKCMICGTEEWFGNKVPLVMDHIYGRSSNNVLENLRLVCANCDALLPTYKSKNKNSDRNWRRKNFGM